MNDRLAIEALSVFALPPLDYVALAADLGCPRITTSLTPFSANPHGYPDWSLRDPAARREMKAAMADRGVSIVLGEGLVVAPRVDAGDYAADLDALVELGVRRINTMSMDADLDRSIAQFAILADMAAAAGVEMAIEFAPILTLANLEMTVDAVRRLDRPNAKLMIDTMHLFRSGGTAAALRAVDPVLIGHIQLSDIDRVAIEADYGTETMTERKVPGTGEAPLLDYLAAMPRDLTVGLEIPLLSRAKAGEGPHERMSDCLRAAEELLARLP